MDCPHLEPVENGEFLKKVEAKMASQRIPFSGSLEVTFRCNLRCVHCYVGDFRSGVQSKAELSTAEMRKILDQIADAGCLDLLLTGGEPLMRPDFLDIYTYAKQKGLMLTLFTNGSLLTPKIVDYLGNWPPQSVEITLYGYSQQTYERVTGISGSHARCMRGIELLLHQGIPLKLKTMLLTLNQHELDDMKHFSESLGVKFRYDPLINAGFDGGKDQLNFRLSPKELVETDLRDDARVVDLIDLARRYEGYVPDTRYLYSCGAGLNSFHIDPFGRMSVCMLARARSYDLRNGNFLEGWEHFFPLERKLPASSDSRCAGCSLRATCPQCPGWAQVESGDAEQAVDFLCQITHLRQDALNSIRH